MAPSWTDGSSITETTTVGYERDPHVSPDA